MTVRTLSLLDALKLDATNLDPQNFCGSGLTVHAIAAMFPLLEGKEFDGLCSNMQSSGLQNAIVVLDGVLLDGRNRLRACAKTGIQPKFAEYSLVTNPSQGYLPISAYGWRKNREDEWIVSQNLHRRSITPDQRAALVAKYYDWRGAEERARQARLAGLVAGGGKPPCATESGSTTPVQQNAVAPPPHKSKNPTRDEIAEKAAVGGGKAAQAISVAKSRPDLLDAVASGKTTLRDAAKQVAPPKPKPALARSTALAAEIETQIEALKSGKINASQAAALFKDARRQVAEIANDTKRDKEAFRAAHKNAGRLPAVAVPVPEAPIRVLVNELVDLATQIGNHRDELVRAGFDDEGVYDDLAAVNAKLVVLLQRVSASAPAPPAGLAETRE